MIIILVVFLISFAETEGRVVSSQVACSGEGLGGGEGTCENQKHGSGTKRSAPLLLITFLLYYSLLFNFLFSPSSLLFFHSFKGQNAAHEMQIEIYLPNADHPRQLILPGHLTVLLVKNAVWGSFASELTGDVMPFPIWVDPDIDLVC